MLNKISCLKKWAIAYLPVLVIAIMVCQPLMDIFSFWIERLGLRSLYSLAPRFLMLALVGLLGLLVARKRLPYFVCGAALALLYAAHFLTARSIGYLSRFSDLTNFIRVAQIPIFTLCFIDFLQANRQVKEAIEKGIYGVFFVITISVALSLITKTGASTYSVKYAFMGWFSTSNSQSAILSVVSTLAVMLAYRRTTKHSPLLLFIVTPLALAQLFFFGTRLCYVAIGAVLLGLILAALLTKNGYRPRLMISLTAIVLVVGVLVASPMLIYRRGHESVMNRRQVALDQEIASQALRKQTQLGRPLNEEEMHELLRPTYQQILGSLCKRFGVERVMEEYDYSVDIRTLTGTRMMKIHYCRMLMEDLPVSARIFGVERQRMYVGNDCFDPENDFHGIFYLYGYAGLAMLLAFLLYFVWRIVRCLRLDFKHFFTVEAAAYGMVFCLLLVNSFFTAGVLRRPNASFYLSLVLAMVYTLSDTKKEEDKHEVQCSDPGL